MAQAIAGFRTRLSYMCRVRSTASTRWIWRAVSGVAQSQILCKAIDAEKAWLHRDSCTGTNLCQTRKEFPLRYIFPFGRKEWLPLNREGLFFYRPGTDSVRFSQPPHVCKVTRYRVSCPIRNVLADVTESNRKSCYQSRTIWGGGLLLLFFIALQPRVE